MALALDIVRGGLSAGNARGINGSCVSGVSAAGTVITDATDLKATTNYVSTVAASSGVQLPSMNVGDDCVVYNGGANALKVYPDLATVAINQLSVGAAVTCPVMTALWFKKVSSTQVVAFMSA